MIRSAFSKQLCYLSTHSELQQDVYLLKKPCLNYSAEHSTAFAVTVAAIIVAGIQR